MANRKEDTNETDRFIMKERNSYGKVKFIMLYLDDIFDCLLSNF